MQDLCLIKLAKDGFLVFDEVQCDITCKPEELAMLIDSFSSLGYTLEKEDIKRLAMLDSEHLKQFYLKNYDFLNEICGNDVEHKVFYKNFPKIKDISVLEATIRAVLHYLTVSVDSDGFMNQDIEDFERQTIHNPNKKVLKFITSAEGKKRVIKLVENLFEAKVAIPYNYFHLAGEVLEDYGQELNINSIPFKENLAHYFSLLLFNKAKVKKSEIITRNSLSFVKTPTDLLRVYAALSRGDVTLKNNVMFMSLERALRRLFLSMLDDMVKDNLNAYDDFSRHEFLWKRAFELLHVGEYKTKYPNIYEIATNFRSGEYQTFYSKLEELSYNQVAYIKLLKTRPGEFARRLDMLIRNEKYDIEYTLSEFKTVASKVSTTLLLQLWEFFKNRTLYPTRIFKINSSWRTNFVEVDDERVEVKSDTIDKVIKMIEESLSQIYSTYEFKGKVYIDPKMKQYCLPRNSRNGSAQTKTLTYGTRIKLNEAEGSFLRVFTHWKNIDTKNSNDRIDIDLTMELVSDDFNKKFTIGWHNLTWGAEFNSYYSGDVTSAPNGASEFIDLDYISARKYARYCIVCNSVYTGHDFADIPECFSGIMLMNNLGKEGEIFNPEFVEHKFDLTQRGANLNAAVVIDLETLELIWMDCPLSYGGNVVASSAGGVFVALKDVLKEHMNLYDFFMLHKGHIEIVDSIDEADIFISDSIDATIKPFDVENIASNWL